MKKFLAILTIVLAAGIQAEESLNSIIAVVKNNPITEIDLEKGTKKYNKVHKFIPEINKGLSKRSRVINFLIDRAIIDLAAEEESIRVNEKNVKAEVKRRMKVMEVTDEKVFGKLIARETGIPYKVWKSEVPYQIKKSQLLQVRISTPLPSEREIIHWYNNNKGKVGFEVSFREFVMTPKSGSISDEMVLSKEMNKIRNATGSPSSFRNLAASPRNESYLRSSGGLVNYLPAYDLYKKSKIFASVASQLNNGEISQVFKDERGRYCIIMLEGKRVTPLDQVRRGIQNMLYREKEEVSFLEWLKEMRSKMDIRYYDRDFMRESGIKETTEEFSG